MGTRSGSSGVSDGKRLRWCHRRPAVAALATTLTLTSSPAFPSILLLWRYSEAERSSGRKRPPDRRTRWDSQPYRDLRCWGRGRATRGGCNEDGSVSSLTSGKGPDCCTRRQAAERSGDLLVNGRSGCYAGLKLEQQGRRVEAESIITPSRLVFWDRILVKTPGDPPR